MKNLVIALIILVVVAVGTYYLVFNEAPAEAPMDNSNAYTPPVSDNNPAPASEVAVDIKDFKYSPATLNIKVGTKVTWTNRDSAPHTVTSDSGNLLDSPTLSTGQSWSFTFTDSGTFNYHCKIHPMMKASVAVAK